MVKNKKVKIIISLVFGLAIAIISNKAFAAESSISAQKTTLEVNQTTTISVNISATEAWNLKLTTSGGTLSGTTEDADSAGSEVSKKVFSANFAASKEGTYTITLSGQVTGSDLVKKNISKSVKITVKAKSTTNNDTTKNNNTSTTTQKSNNAYLSTLGVTPKEYDFSGFSKTKTSYSVTVPNDVDSLKVSYKTADPKATVKVTGNSGFDVGSNNAIKVVVTAEDGKTTKTYTIKVTKLATEDDKPGNLIEEDTNLYLTSLSLDDLELSPEFAKDTYSYSATLSNSDITDLKVEAKANNDKANIDISGNTGLVEGENTINIILTLEGSSVKTVYQVVVTKDAAYVATTSENAQNSSNDLMGSIKKYIGIVVAVIVLMIVAVIVLIILLRKENKRLNGEDVIEDDENQNNEEKYNVYKNDVNEFKNNNNEPENFIESLYRQRNGNLYNEEELDEQDKETLEEINKETDNIFRDKVQGQSVEYDNTEFGEENPLEERRKRRGKGKHF